MSKILMDKTWLDVLKDEFEKPYMKNLQKFLSEEVLNKNKVFPEKKDIFNAFCYTSLDNVKVVIMGQDPYHGDGQAHGLSFSVLRDVKPPPSLRNIYKEIHQDLGLTTFNHGCLTGWAEQGVLLLNATLTVREREPKSHYKMGWEVFTDRAIDIITNKKEPVVFLLWGKSAQENFQKLLDNKKSHHLVLTAAHPSFYSMRNFFGCKHFSKTNDFLKKNNKTPIDWNIY